MSGKDYSQSTSNFESFRKENKSNWHFDPSIESNDYDDFYKRVQKHYSKLDAMGVTYGFESTPITSNVI